MPFPGIISNISHTCIGAGTYNSLEVGAGLITALLAFSDNVSDVDSITIHDSLNATSSPNPILVIYVAGMQHIDILRPPEQGIYCATGVSVVIVGTNANLHFTYHKELTV